MEPPSLLSLHLLGVPKLVRADGTAQLLERRDAALLALLAIDGPTARSRLIGLLWPDSDARRGANSLRQRVFRLRRWAACDVVSGDRTLGLAPQVAFELGHPYDPNSADAAELLGSADYGDCSELADWIEKARGLWRTRRRQALAEQASRLEAEGQLAAALQTAERLALDDPSSEHAHRRVMRLHYLRGDRAAALAAYERCVRQLEHHLGSEPGEETQQLAATIERSGALQVDGRALRMPLPAELRRPPRLIGRDAEWRLLEQAAAQGCSVLLDGLPGSGKTRLLQDHAQAKRWLAPVGARPGDDVVPYALAARWLDALRSRYAPPLTPELQRELAPLLPRTSDALPAGMLEPSRLTRALADVLALCRPTAQGAAQEGTPGLSLDDLQFADSASLGLLLELAAAPERGWVWVLAFRSHAEPAPVSQWYGRRAPGQVLQIHLAALNEAHVEALLASLQLPGLDPRAWAAPLLAYCGGQPFFIVDALAALHLQGLHEFSAGPDAVAAAWRQPGAVSRRIEQLPDDARQLAQVAAVAGQDFDVDLAAALLRCPPVALVGPWHALEQAGLFRGGGFAHDLLGQAVSASIPEAIARILHRQVAVWLEDGSAAPPRAAHVAAHWEAGGEPARAATRYDDAADQAQARSAASEELRAREAAARCHRAARTPDGDERAFRADWRSVHLLLGLESADVALAHAEALLACAVTPSQRAAALEARARVLCERFEPEAGLADAQAARALATDAGETRLRLLAEQRAATALMRLARPAEAVVVQQASLGLLDGLSDEERLYWLSDHATALDYADRRIEAVQMFDRTIRQAAAVGHWGAEGEAWGNKAIALMYLNRMGESVEASKRAIECSRRAGAEHGNLLIDEMTLLGSLRDLGRFDAYLAQAESLPQRLREAGYPVWAWNAENDLAICFLWLGRPELAHRTLSPIPDDQPPMIRASRWFTQARLWRGRSVPEGTPGPAALVRAAHALIESAGGTGRSYVRLKVALEQSRDDDAPGALARIAALEAEMLEREQFMLAMQALLLRTELLASSGAHVEAAAAGRELLERCVRDGPLPGLYAPEVWWTIHHAAAPADAATAAEALRRGIAWIEHDALPHVPDVFRPSFLERNPFNVRLRAAAVAHG
ncbi:MAG: AAA family ATPase [Proteobacteria bacterium]|nr:AAA family ATPase [Pseudomonadota bacterium]